MKKLLFYSLFALTLLAVPSCGDDDEDEPTTTPSGNETKNIAVSGLTLDKEAVTLEEGTTLTLTATVTPDNATDKTVTWTSSDASVATVTDGKVTAVKEGEATITAKAGDKTAECKVTVAAPAPIPDGCVDLGLPSGLLWTTCNIGALNPQDYGDYYAWGEIETKDDYSYDTYKYGTADNAYTKYCIHSLFAINSNADFTDGLTVLEASDDVATEKLGSDYRMPTLDECAELIDNTYNEWTDNYNSTGVAGRIFYKKKDGDGYTTADTHIFLPAAGIRLDSDLQDAGSDGSYWSSSLNLYSPWCGHCIGLGSDHLFADGSATRTDGIPVRAVRRK